MKATGPAVILFVCASSAVAQSQSPPQTPSPDEPQGFVVEHVPERLPPAAQKVEDRCVRLTDSHAARGRDDRQTKGTQGTHGDCEGRSFSGTTNDLGSAVQAPVK